MFELPLVVLDVSAKGTDRLAVSTLVGSPETLAATWEPYAKWLRDVPSDLAKLIRNDPLRSELRRLGPAVFKMYATAYLFRDELKSNASRRPKKAVVDHLKSLGEPFDVEATRDVAFKIIDLHRFGRGEIRPVFNERRLSDERFVWLYRREGFVSDALALTLFHADQHANRRMLMDGRVIWSKLRSELYSALEADGFCGKKELDNLVKIILAKPNI